MSALQQQREPFLEFLSKASKDEDYRQRIEAMGHLATYQVAQVLEKLAETADLIPSEHFEQLGHSNQVTPFHSKTACPISIMNYFVTVCINSGLQGDQAIAVLILIERLCQSASNKDTTLVINALTVHR